MSKTLCASVRLASLTSISSKAYLATSYDGSSDIIPKSQVFGQDFDVVKSDAYWISLWILEKKKIQYSTKKKIWIDEYGKKSPFYTIETHKPIEIKTVLLNEIDELKR